MSDSVLRELCKSLKRIESCAASELLTDLTWRHSCLRDCVCCMEDSSS